MWRMLFGALAMAIAMPAVAQTGGGYAGLSLMDISVDELAEALGVRKGQGLLVQNFGADANGVEPGDIITAFDGTKATTVAAAIAQISSRAPGSVMSLNIMRSGVPRTVTLTLQSRPSTMPMANDALDQIRSRLADANLRQKWGVLLDLAGRDFGGTYTHKSLQTGVSVGSTFRWIIPGRLLREVVWDRSNSLIGRIIRVTDTPGQLRFYWKQKGSPTFTSTMHVLASGEVVSVTGASGGLGSGSYRISYSKTGDGRFLFVTSNEKSDGFQQVETVSYGAVEQSPAAIQVKATQIRATMPEQPGFDRPEPVRVAAAETRPPPPVRAEPAVVTVAPVVALPSPAVRQPAGRPRLALVIGNAAYGANLGSLANAANDAHAVTAALRASGFTVIEATNLDQKSMKRAIIAFGQRLSAAGRGATGLFYYAGHGIQSRGINYLAPVGAAIETEADVDIEAVAADTVLRQMEEAGASTSIVILDACRNLPVQRSFRDATRGLARMDAPNGSFVAYSTAPGSVAADGSGANSPFATALIAEMGKPGQSIEAVFRNVRRNVLAATGGKQTPWDSSSLLDGFVFTPEK